MTNADGVRKMTDEEIAMFLMYGISGMFANLKKDNEQNCHDKILEWLKLKSD